MKKWNIAVLGATGAVGQEMLKVLAERNFPVGEIKALASKPSAGKITHFGSKEIVIEEATDASFNGMDLCWAQSATPWRRNLLPR